MFLFSFLKALYDSDSGSVIVEWQYDNVPFSFVCFRLALLEHYTDSISSSVDVKVLGIYHKAIYVN